jgi:hypothetical protein
MKIINFILSLFTRSRQPVFGPRIFQQRTWLAKQVDEAQYKRTFLLD